MIVLRLSDVPGTSLNSMTAIVPCRSCPTARWQSSSIQTGQCGGRTKRVSPLASAQRPTVADATRAARHLTSLRENSAPRLGAVDGCDACRGTSVALCSAYDYLPAQRVPIPGTTEQI